MCMQLWACYGHERFFALILSLGGVQMPSKKSKPKLHLTQKKLKAYVASIFYGI